MTDEIVTTTKQHIQDMIVQGINLALEKERSLHQQDKTLEVLKGVRDAIISLFGSVRNRHEMMEDEAFSCPYFNALNQQLSALDKLIGDKMTPTPKHDGGE